MMDVTTRFYSILMQAQPVIKIAFVDPRPEQGYVGIHFMDLLHKHFPIEVVSAEEADYLFYSDFGLDHLDSTAVKIFYTGENHEADWVACDYALTHERARCARHRRLPYYALATLEKSPEEWEVLLRRDPWTHEDVQREKSAFCHFVYRNHVCKVRNRFFKKLSQYKHVDAAGPLYNNMKDGMMAPRGLANTLAFMAPYKFSISFENEAHRGYTTEKLFNALLARTVPIYWGDPTVAEDFNPKSFINYYDFQSEQELLDYVIHVDENEELYLQYLNEPIFKEGQGVLGFREEVRGFFEEIFSNPDRQRSCSEQRYFEVKKKIGSYAFARFKAWKRRFTKRKR